MLTYEPGHVSCHAAARALGVHYWTVRALLAARVLDGGHYGRHPVVGWYVTRASLAAFIKHRVLVGVGRLAANIPSQEQTP